MKFLIAFALCALAACINANPYGNIGYGSDLGQVAYVQDIGYGGGWGRGIGGGRGGLIGGYGGYRQPLISRSSNPSAAAAASAASAGIRPGNYRQAAVIGYDLDASWHGNSYGRGGHGRGY
ncbi:PREDICTED: chorion protein S15 [Drosophila arizonae]|uniref:Chorion protein S15 n=1 Tax=Drosophila arizonae TaxID=7263 RepID=A0ABM1P4I6_DROAR|nr:PREDICTED: chorion protein S15 [Drosophila arizonae]